MFQYQAIFFHLCFISISFLISLLVIEKLSKGEFQICPRMDLDNIFYVEYLRYNNYKNEIILFLERC